MSTLSTSFTLQLPDHWTPEQALAVYEFLTELADALWNRYEIPLIELLKTELEHNDPPEPDLSDFDDPIPF